ncbi:MAG TPA: LapA family protein [Candidatus Methylomirabilis sp.]|nr:LapA family protein [Candidatus Methylomirabilis sp.]
MTQFYLIFALLLATLVATFAVQNAERIEVHFLVWSFESSVVVLILVSAGLGALLAALISLPQAVKLKRRLRESEARLVRPAELGSRSEGGDVPRGQE